MGGLMFKLQCYARKAVSFAAALVLGLGPLAAPQVVHAQGAASLFQHEKYAAIVVDANTGEVLYARRADEQRYPASITKILTLYLTFEALSTGRLSLSDRVVVSPHAFAQAPSKLGLRPGESLTVDEAMRAVAVKSANDIAVALAEKIGGSEQHFASLMTLRAQELGMTNSRFVNASGLPDTRQVSSARDIAILSRAVMRDYPQYYSYFGIKALTWRGQEIPNHNGLLRRMSGVDGLKTGYTGAAGFNLAASAVRNGKRLIAVVLGGSSTAARDENVEDLLNSGFQVFAKRAEGKSISLASMLHEPPDAAGGPVLRPATEMGSAEQPGLKIVLGDASTPLPASLRTASPPPLQPAVKSAASEQTAAAPCTPSHARRHRRAQACESAKVLARTETEKAGGGYAVQVGAFTNSTQAKAHLAQLSAKFGKVLASDGKVEKAGRGHFRAEFGGLSRSAAKDACRRLAAHGERCLVVRGAHG